MFQMFEPENATRLTRKRRQTKIPFKIVCLVYLSASVLVFLTLLQHPRSRWTWRMPTRPNMPSVWFWPWWVAGIWISIFTTWASLDWARTESSSTLRRSAVGSCTSITSRSYTGQSSSTALCIAFTLEVYIPLNWFKPYFFLSGI